MVCHFSANLTLNRDKLPLPVEAAINVPFKAIEWNQLFGLQFIRQLEEEQEETTTFTKEFTWKPEATGQ